MKVLDLPVVTKRLLSLVSSGNENASSPGFWDAACKMSKTQLNRSLPEMKSIFSMRRSATSAAYISYSFIARALLVGNASNLNQYNPGMCPTYRCRRGQLSVHTSAASSSSHTAFTHLNPFSVTSFMSAFAGSFKEPKDSPKQKSPRNQSSLT